MYAETNVPRPGCNSAQVDYSEYAVDSGWESTGLALRVNSSPTLVTLLVILAALAK